MLQELDFVTNTLFIVEKCNIISFIFPLFFVLGFFVAAQRNLKRKIEEI
jgi:hypothetical protein